MRFLCTQVSPWIALGTGCLLGSLLALKSEGQGYLCPASSWSLVLRGMCVPAGPPCWRNMCEACVFPHSSCSPRWGPAQEEEEGERERKKGHLSSLRLSFPIFIRTETTPRSVFRVERRAHMLNTWHNARTCQQTARPATVGFRRGLSCEGCGDRSLSQV